MVVLKHSCWCGCWGDQRISRGLVVRSCLLRIRAFGDSRNAFHRAGVATFVMCCADGPRIVRALLNSLSYSHHNIGESDCFLSGATGDAGIGFVTVGDGPIYRAEG